MLRLMTNDISNGNITLLRSTNGIFFVNKRVNDFRKILLLKYKTLHAL